MKIAVYCGANSGADPAFLQAASKVGAWIAARGDTLIYGGGKLGLMGAVAQSALDHGGDVIGIMPQVLADRGLAMPALTHLEVVADMGTPKWSRWQMPTLPFPAVLALWKKSPKQFPSPELALTQAQRSCLIKMGITNL